jgi:hypothetical protein
MPSATGTARPRRSRRLRAAPAAALACALLAAAAPAHAQRARAATRVAPRLLLSSRNLWATIDVCSPADQRDAVGVRGSMPGDGESGDRMFMTFRLQMQVRKTGRWKNVGQASEYVLVGAAGMGRQAGTSFVIRPPSNGKQLNLRGVILFQWRHGTTVVQSARRVTSAGHESAAGADPANFSAATCSIG